MSTVAHRSSDDEKPPPAALPYTPLEVLKLCCTVHFARLGRLRVRYTVDIPTGTAWVEIRDAQGVPVPRGELLRSEHLEIAWQLCRNMAEQLQELDLEAHGCTPLARSPRSGVVEVLRAGGEVRGLRAGPQLGADELTPPRGTPIIPGAPPMVDLLGRVMGEGPFGQAFEDPAHQGPLRGAR